MKRILVVNNDLTYFNLHRKKFIKAIHNKNIEITLLFPNLFKNIQYKYEIDNLIENGYKVKFFFLKRKSINFFVELRSIFSLILLVNRYDVIYTSTLKLNLYLIIINYFKKAKLILHFSGLGYFYVNNNIYVKNIRKIIEIFFRIFQKKDTFSIFENKFDKEYFVDIKNIFKNNQCLVIDGVGVDIEKFNTVKKDSNIFNILMVSRITYEKGVKEYLNCYEFFKNNNNYKFYLVGPYENSVTNKKLMDKIQFFNQYENFEYHAWSDNINFFYKKAHISVLPSYREGLSVFLMESLASGLPLIVSDIPANKSLVKKDFNGYLVNIKSPIEIKKAIMEISSDREKYYKFSNNSRNLSEQYFDENIIINKFSKFLKNKKIL